MPDQVFLVRAWLCTRMYLVGYSCVPGSVLVCAWLCTRMYLVVYLCVLCFRRVLRTTYRLLTGSFGCFFPDLLFYRRIVLEVM